MSTFDPDKITFFVKTDARGQAIPFGIKAKDRQRHMYVVGKTGMGKSTLLENMAAQDIQNGEGMAFIDPHGSAAETLLEYVPEHRVKDVVYLAPFDLNHPIAFNVMEDVGPDKRHLVVSGLMSTFKKIWVDAWSARMEYILTNALLALIEYPDTTLLSVNRLFVDKAYRNQVIEYIKDPAVKAFWTDEFANYTDRFAAEALPAIQNKIGQFTGNPLIRNIIGQPHSSFDIRKIMDEKKILIMNLSKGLIGETNANLLGSMLTTRIYLAAMSRADLSVDVMKTMPNFYFYVDEFQSFANATFANILSEARKYHLNLIIAHQYIEQMEEDVRNAVFGNVGTTVAFRVGPFDAEVLETVFSPRFLAPDLVNLGFAQIYLTLMIDGIGSQPFSAQTLPPVQRPPISCRNMVIASSRKLFANEREAVEETVARLHNPVKPEPSASRRTDTRRPPAQNGNRTSTQTSTTANRPSTPRVETPVRDASTSPSVAPPPNPSTAPSVTLTEETSPSQVETPSQPPAVELVPPRKVVPEDGGEVRRSPRPHTMPPARSIRPPERTDQKRRPMKPTSSPSLDDLRAILKQVSRKDEGELSKPVPRPSDKPHSQSSGPSPTSPDAHSPQASGTKTQATPAASQVRTPDQSSQPPRPPVTPHTQATSAPNPSSLKSALAAVIKEVNQVSVPETHTGSSDPEPTPPISSSPSSIPAAGSTIREIETTTSTDAKIPQTVDIARVKQLLRSPLKGRNPFA